jgi:nitrogenase molybdenum-iron protein beta chain
MARHFREPIEVAITSLHEKATIFGGASNLKQALGNIIERKHPELITVITTCLSETTGDDIHGITKAFRAENKNLAEKAKIVTINTPSYVGNHVLGYDNAIKAMVSQLAVEKTKPNSKINVIPGMINPGDVLEIKHMLELMDVDAIYLTDISQTLNAPLRLPKPEYPRGGTTVKEIADAANSLGTITVCKRMGQAAANQMQEKHGIPACFGPTPIGIGNTEAFIQNITKLTGKPPSDALMDERDLLVDAYADSNMLVFGVKVAIFGDPDMVIALTRFVYELGMQPVHLMTTLDDKQFAAEIEAVAKEYDAVPEKLNIIVAGDLLDLEDKIKVSQVDMIIGDYKGKYIAKKEDIPLVRVGFPQADRFGYQRRAMMGYRGTLQLLDTIVNTVLDNRD